MTEPIDVWGTLLETRHMLVRLHARVRALESEVRELRALVTPLDTGSLPNESEGT